MELIIQENSAREKDGFVDAHQDSPEQCLIKRHSLLAKKNKRSQIKTKYFERLKPQSRGNKFSLKEADRAIGQQFPQIQGTKCILLPTGSCILANDPKGTSYSASGIRGPPDAHRKIEEEVTLLYSEELRVSAKLQTPAPQCGLSLARPSLGHPHSRQSMLCPHQVPLPRGL